MHIIGNDNDLCIKRMLDNAYKQLENSIENQCYMNSLNQRNCNMIILYHKQHPYHNVYLYNQIEL